MMLEVLVLAASLVCSGFVVYQVRNQRRPPLKNSVKTVITAALRGSVGQLVLYLPGDNFINNISAAADSERKALSMLWKQDSAVFNKLWPTISKQEQDELVCKLIEELKLSIQPYSDSDNLLLAICPEIHDKIHKENTGDGLSAKPAEKDVKEEICSFIEATICKDSSFHSKGKVITLSAEPHQSDLDPNHETMPNFVLMEKAESFLFALRKICFVRYVKQLLERYRLEPKKSTLSRAWDKFGVAFLVSIAAFVLTFALDHFGLLERFLVSYKSPFYM